MLSFKLVSRVILKILYENMYENYMKTMSALTGMSVEAKRSFLFYRILNTFFFSLCRCCDNLPPFHRLTASQPVRCVQMHAEVVVVFLLSA